MHAAKYVLRLLAQRFRRGFAHRSEPAFVQWLRERPLDEQSGTRVLHLIVIFSVVHILVGESPASLSREPAVQANEDSG